MNPREEFIDAYEAHRDALFRYALLKLDDRERALDAVQNTFANTWSYIAEGNTVKAFKPFLYRVLHNMVVNEYKKQRTTSLEGLTEEGFDVGTDEHEALQDRLDGARAIALIAELPDDYRDAVFMRYVEDMTLDEIAIVTGISKNALAVRIYRGLQKLKKHYAQA